MTEATRSAEWAMPPGRKVPVEAVSVSCSRKPDRLGGGAHAERPDPGDGLPGAVPASVVEAGHLQPLAIGESAGEALEQLPI
jgi:hypothetical protein